MFTSFSSEVFLSKEIQMANKHEDRIKEIQEQVANLNAELSQIKEEKSRTDLLMNHSLPVSKAEIKYQDSNYYLTFIEPAEHHTNDEIGFLSFKLTSDQLHDLITKLHQELEAHEVTESEQKLMKLLDHFFLINNFNPYSKI
jgi:hypothetical protein